eukprot:353077-Chlamydomonas_euryale.AAC.18
MKLRYLELDFVMMEMNLWSLSACALMAAALHSREEGQSPVVTGHPAGPCMDFRTSRPQAAFAFRPRQGCCSRHKHGIRRNLLLLRNSMELAATGLPRMEPREMQDVRLPRERAAWLGSGRQQTLLRIRSPPLCASEPKLPLRPAHVRPSPPDRQCAPTASPRGRNEDIDRAGGRAGRGRALHGAAGHAAVGGTLQTPPAALLP